MFGLKPNKPAGPAIVRIDATAGIFAKHDWDYVAREKVVTDLTDQRPVFVGDFGQLDTGYVHFAADGPKYVMAPAEYRPLPDQPEERNAQGQFLYRPGFRIKLHGKVLDGTRELSSTAICVCQVIERLYYEQYWPAPEAAAGKQPIVRLDGMSPIAGGRGPQQKMRYAPVFTIIGWTDRRAEWGEPTNPPPSPQKPGPAPTMIMAVPLPKTAPARDARDDLNDAIPF